MTIEEAVDKILGEAITWVEANSKVRPEWTINNFPGMFLYACSKELPRTAEVGAMYIYQRRATFNSRYLSFDIKDGKLSMIKLHPYETRYGMDGTIGKLNKAFSDALYEYKLKGLKPEYTRSLLDKIDRTRGSGFDVEKPVVHDTRRIEAFDFAPSKLFIKP